MEKLNQVIEQFIKSSFSESEILELNEVTNLVTQIPISDINPNIVSEIRKYGISVGYRSNETGLTVYVDSSKTEVWVESLF